MAPMAMARVGLAAATVNGKIYAIGGSNSILNNNSVLNTVEVYDPSSDSWGAAANMSTTRSYFAAAALQGKIYAIGGFDSNSSVKNTVEVHDPACTSPCPIPWTAVASMPTARAGLAVIPVDGKIYAIGGRNNSAAVNLWKSMIPVPIHGAQLPTSLRCGNLRLRAMLTVWFTPWVGMMVGLVRIPSGHRSNGTPPR